MKRPTAQRKEAEQKGRWAENWVAMVMIARGYRVLARRFRSPSGEIDLIICRGDDYRFIEVKYRKQATDDQLDQILPSPNAQLRIRNTAEYFAATMIDRANINIYLDCVIVTGAGKLRWFEHSF